MGGEQEREFAGVGRRKELEGGVGDERGEVAGGSVKDAVETLADIGKKVRLRGIFRGGGIQARPWRMRRRWGHRPGRRISNRLSHMGVVFARWWGNRNQCCYRAVFRSGRSQAFETHPRGLGVGFDDAVGKPVSLQCRMRKPTLACPLRFDSQWVISQSMRSLPPCMPGRYRRRAGSRTEVAPGELARRARTR